MEKLLTLDEVSAILGSKDPQNCMVRELCRTGRLESARIGRRRMVRERSVQRFIETAFKNGQQKS